MVGALIRRPSIQVNVRRCVSVDVLVAFDMDAIGFEINRVRGNADPGATY